MPKNLLHLLTTKWRILIVDVSFLSSLYFSLIILCSFYSLLLILWLSYSLFLTIWPFYSLYLIPFFFLFLIPHFLFTLLITTHSQVILSYLAILSLFLITRLFYSLCFIPFFPLFSISGQSTHHYSFSGHLLYNSLFPLLSYLYLSIFLLFLIPVSFLILFQYLVHLLIFILYSSYSLSILPFTSPLPKSTNRFLSLSYFLPKL